MAGINKTDIMNHMTSDCQPQNSILASILEVLGKHHSDHAFNSKGKEQWVVRYQIHLKYGPAQPAYMVFTDLIKNTFVFLQTNKRKLKIYCNQDRRSNIKILI